MMNEEIKKLLESYKNVAITNKNERDSNEERRKIEIINNPTIKIAVVPTIILPLESNFFPFIFKSDFKFTLITIQTSHSR